MDNRKLRGKAPYSWEDLKTSDWNTVRLRILEAHNRICFRCGATRVRLSVHHTVYEEGKKAWEYEDKTLVPLCDDCHYREHFLDEDMVYIIDKTILSGGEITIVERKEIAKSLGYKESKVRNICEKMIDSGLLEKEKIDGVVYFLTNRHILYYPYFDLFNKTTIEHTDKITGVVSQSGDDYYVGKIVTLPIGFEIISFETDEQGISKANIKQPDLKAIILGKARNISYKEIVPPFVRKQNIDIREMVQKIAKKPFSEM